MSDIMDALGRIGLVPVVRIERVEDAGPLGDALKRGGLPCAEITFRTPAAPAAIARIVSAHPDFVVGAGTVLTVDQAGQALDAGAQFVVSPGFSPRVVDWCIERDVPVLPGIVSPTEIMAGLDRGLRIFKFFPAEAYGGIATIKALSAPFSGVRYMPTGGITARNLADYLALPAVHAVGGSWMVERKLLSNGQFDEIAQLAAEACAIVRSVRGTA
jgi:2-dehydro-3-deoxyphosphogluconate aldolase/(4S)-4-hydroxy-2-oxoglutarate aldolase